MKLADAEEIAYEITEAIAPFCERVSVAGSIRRRKPEVKDIEICAIPTWSFDLTCGNDLFGDPDTINLLHQFCQEQEPLGIAWIKPGTHNIIPWRIRPEGKYWRGYFFRQDLKLDLFLCEPDNWGWIFAIRTGSAEFSTALLTHAKRLGYHSEKGRLCRQSNPIATPEEEDVFRILNLAFVAPELRQDEQALKSLK